MAGRTARYSRTRRLPQFSAPRAKALGSKGPEGRDGRREFRRHRGWRQALGQAGAGVAGGAGWRPIGGEIEARLRDLSQKGALVECMEVPPVGSEVMFVRGATRVPARVAWAGTDRIGLEFHHEIDEHEVLVQLGKQPAGQAGRLPPPALPGSCRPRTAASPRPGA